MSKKEPKEYSTLTLAGALILLLTGMFLSLWGLFKKDLIKNNTSKQKTAHVSFNDPKFQVGDCFLVSKAGEKLHPHYLKIVNKNMDQKEFDVLETIGNGSDEKVTLYFNSYEDLGSFDKYRSSCPDFYIKEKN